ncbi:hypothetical protein CYMTET_43710 [Cymbomonas tetramitiformis]|uniref:Cyclic nucleotide-binding domain-containing protein n=1 Tax=Cymbomonas tetramitiformis TaxID=36881 RepID=A0AAE0C1L2_9CHLO|nr:hypothetical protein CYMTET_43710 [Cymbomonas tetramitiformis]
MNSEGWKGMSGKPHAPERSPRGVNTKPRLSTQRKIISRYTALTPADAAYRVSSPLHFLKQFCQQRPQDRTDVDVNQALKVLSETFNFNFFGVHSQEEQKRICCSFHFASYRKNEVIFKGGAVGAEAFLLLSGTVRCIEDAFRWVVTPGEDFGLVKEVRKMKLETMEDQVPFRNAHSAVALEDAWTLHLSMEELANALSTPTELQLKKLEETGAFFRSLSLFKARKEDTLSKLMKYSRRELFKRGTEWSTRSSQTMYFIVKGEVIVMLPLKQIDAIEEDSDEEGAYALQVSRNNRMKETVKKPSKYTAKASTRHYPNSWNQACKNYGYLEEGKLGPSAMLVTLGEGRYFGHEAWFPFRLPQYDLLMVAETQVVAIAVEKDAILDASRNDHHFLSTLLQESLFLVRSPSAHQESGSVGDLDVRQGGVSPRGVYG